jgi:hypothetical protein
MHPPSQLKANQPFIAKFKKQANAEQNRVNKPSSQKLLGFI